MEIYNVEEHLSCYCYEGGDNPLIEVRKIKRMETGETLLSRNEIVLVISGKIRINIIDNLSGELSKGQFVFLPSGFNVFFKAIAKSQIMIFRLDESIHLCYSYSLEQLYNRVKNIEKPQTLSILEFNIRIWDFANNLVNTWEDGLRCRLYLLAKINELLLLMRAYYPEEQLGQFFYFILSSDTAFSEFVRMSYLQYPTVNKLAEALNMSSQQFTRRFNNVFGQAPYGWMQREKARLIYGEICRSDKPIKEIAAKFGFLVPANFNRFCKMAFGMNPGAIRKKRT
jgi:AraC-like DNA-binding protein